MGPFEMEPHQYKSTAMVADDEYHPQHPITVRPPPSKRELLSASLVMIMFYCLSVATMAGLTILFVQLDGQPVATSGISQSIAGALANFLALIAEIFLVTGICIAFNQIVWRSLRGHDTLSVGTIDTLLGLPGAPWDLVRPSMLRHAGPVKWLIGLSCILIPIAAMFPAGALTVEFENSVRPTVLRDVATMNISDIGDLSYRSFISRLLFDSTSALFLGKNIPQLTSLAGTVLATGAPVQWPTPCSGPCTYKIVMEGPRFNCRNQSLDDSLVDVCDGSSLFYKAQDWAEPGSSFVSNNSFQLSWATKMDINNLDNCKDEDYRSMDCSVTRASYEFSIDNAENGTRTIETKILEDNKEMWTDDLPIQAYFYEYWYDPRSGELYDEPLNQTDLRRNFTNTQAYAIRRAAVEALSGTIDIYPEGTRDSRTVYLLVNQTLAVGSPYVGLTDRYEPRLHLTNDTLQQYLQDLLISTISLNPASGDPIWTNSDPIDAMEGAETYIFEEKIQFYVPYGACLFVAACIYILGLYAMWKSGSPAGGSLIQFVTTLSASERLRELGEQCSLGRNDQAMGLLEDLQIRYGVSKTRPVAGLGTVEEVDPW